MFLVEKRTQQVDFFWITVLAKFCQIVAEQHFVAIFFNYPFFGIIGCGCKFEQDIFIVHRVDFLYEVAPHVGVVVVGFVADENKFHVLEILKREPVLAHVEQKPGRQHLDWNELDVDAMLVGLVEIFHFAHQNLFSTDDDFFGEEIFWGICVKEVVFGLLNDVVWIDEEHEVAVALFVKIEHRASHNHGFAAASCHVEQQVIWAWLFAVEIVVQKIDHAAECFNLIRSQFKPLFYILAYAVRQFVTDGSELRQYVELFV